MWAKKGASLLRAILEPLNRWAAIAGAAALSLMVLLLVADILLRLVANTTVPAALEVVRLLLIFVVFSGMSAVELTNSHIRVDILSNQFSAKARLIIITNANILVMVIVCLISLRCALHSETLIGRHSGLLHIPLWPFPILIGIAMGLFSLAVFVQVLESVSRLIAFGSTNYLWLAPGILLSTTFLVTGMLRNVLPSGLEPVEFGIICLLLMFLLIFFQVHIGAAMALIAFWGVSYLADPIAGTSMLGMVSEEVGSNYLWCVIPLFIWMGMLVFKAKFSEDLYHTAYKWLGHLPGGLASASVAACSAFAAVVGDTVTGAVTMGTIALPEMKKYSYDDKLATGCICAGGSLGTLIPPALGFVVYGIVVEQSIGRLFISGILPGVLATIGFILLIYIRCRINPQLGPAGQAPSFREKLVSLKNSFPVVGLFLLVIGGLYTGYFSPTEAGAVGAFFALLIGLFSRRLKLREAIDSIRETMVMSAMLFFILIYASALTQLFSLTNIPTALAEFISSLILQRYLTLLLILLMYLVLGCLMPALPVLILTLPVIFPLVKSLGFDPIWFGVLVVMMAEIGVITPPIGITVFALGGITNVPMYTIFRGVFPFWLVLVGVVLLVLIFPQIALFLPSLM